MTITGVIIVIAAAAVVVVVVAAAAATASVQYPVQTSGGGINEWPKRNLQFNGSRSR